LDCPALPCGSATEITSSHQYLLWFRFPFLLQTDHLGVLLAIQGARVGIGTGQEEVLHPVRFSFTTKKVASLTMTNVTDVLARLQPSV
jgi:hypothetical protein